MVEYGVPRSKRLTAEFLTRAVVTVPGTAMVREAAKVMSAGDIGCVLISKGRKLAGIFAESDLLNRVVARDKDVRSLPVAQVMTRRPITLDASEPLHRVFEVLSHHRFRQLPVTENGRLVGIISLADLARLRDAFSKDKRIQRIAGRLQNGRK